MTGDIHWLSAAELGRRYAAGQLSPREVVQALLARIDRLDPKLNAFIRLDRDQVMADATTAEREIKAGRSRGPLHGVPVGLKDIIDVAGAPTTCHSRILLDNVATEDAAVVAQLRQAGAIPMGKLATHEFALGGPIFDLPFPPARNPWNPDRHPGGSSSGSGAAVASGMLPLALGTDTGGSVRNPAGACGIVGLKPTYETISRKGVFPLSYTLDHVGPLSRTVEDAALLMQAVTGRDHCSSLEGGMRGLKVGVVRHFHQVDMTCDAEVGAAFEAAAALVAAEGAEVGEATLGDLNEYAIVNRVIMEAEGWAVHGPWLRERPEDYGALTRKRLLTGGFVTAADLLDAQRRRTHMIARVEEVFRRFDVLLCANAMHVAAVLADEPEVLRTYPRHARAPFNVTGHPAIAVMAGLSADGLPMSVQFVGRCRDEPTLLRAAAAFERVAGWSSRRPPMAA